MEVIDEKQMENIMKKAIVSLLEEKNEKFIKIISESFEDFALGKAIKEGMDTDNIPEYEVMEELEK